MAEARYIHLDLVTMEKSLYKGDVLAITAPTSTGEVTILPDHIPLITTLQAGELKLKVDEGKGIHAPDMLFVAISGGFMEVKPKSRVSILVESGLLIDEIDENAANQVREKMEGLLKEYTAGKQQLSDQEFAGAAAQLGKALAQLKVLRRKRRG